MIAPLMPVEVASHEVRGEEMAGHLFPEEVALIARAVESRRREFTSGRLCAHAALHRLGALPRPILRGPDREPLWPDGVVGSITHCEGYRAACVAWRRDVASIGIDAELAAPLPDGVMDQVATAAERAWLQEAPPGCPWDRVLFSAKESLYKAWYPLARCWLGFEDAVVTIRPRDGTFSARVLVEPPRSSGHGLATWSGRFLVRDGLVLTSVVVPGPGTVPGPDAASRPTASDGGEPDLDGAG